MHSSALVTSALMHIVPDGKLGERVGFKKISSSVLCNCLLVLAVPMDFTALLQPDWHDLMYNGTLKVKLNFDNFIGVVNRLDKCISRYQSFLSTSSKVVFLQ